MTRSARLIAAALTVLAVAAACVPGPPEAPAPTDAPDPGPFSVILFIGDGAGLNQWSAARIAYSGLAVEAFPVIGLVGTSASNSRVTDSAAGATAFAAGIKTFNGAIGVGPDSAAVETVLERARSRRKATGLVATSAITHATPASFAAHVPSRDMYFEIAADMVEARVDVMLGGGRAFFDPANRPDGRDLLAALRRGHTVVDSAAGFADLDLTGVTRLVGFTADEHPPVAVRRVPNLARLTDIALEVLARDSDGFFLMVEGSQIDWQGHGNAPLADLVPEIKDFDLAIAAAIRFQERRPNTLIVVTADHETGGLALHGDQMGVFRAHYTTEGHTAGMVPLFAMGPGAERLGGIWENDRIGRILMELIDGDGPH